MAISPVNVVNIIESAAAAAAQNDGSMPIATISNTVPTQRASMAMRGRSPTAALMAHAGRFF
jgi:hypothetical protein